MKKVIILFLLSILYVSPVFAKNVKVEALSDFSTQNPPETWSVKVVEGFVTQDGYTIYTDSILKGKIEDVTEPKRLKRDATFKFIPTSYYDSNTKSTYKVSQDMVGSYSFLSDVSVGSVVKQGAIMASSHFICGFISPGVALVEGAVKNEEGNRAKSAAISVYESSPISYVSKGKELDIKKGDIFIMNFQMLDEDEKETEVENKPNFEYTME
jgi:hypothetical protein